IRVTPSPPADRPRTSEDHRLAQGAPATTKERKLQMENSQPQTGNKPAAKIRLGRIQASIWENASEKGPYWPASSNRA
ncbi:MAG: hypothetical protein O7A06_01915, partial [Acidobacteria bacterium]|nr:hypothetical protein [Acidobacteriota bacterium]